MGNLFYVIKKKNPIFNEDRIIHYVSNCKNYFLTKRILPDFLFTVYFLNFIARPMFNFC